MAIRKCHLHDLTAAVLCLFFADQSWAAAPDIESVLDQHRATLGLIQNLACHIEIAGPSRSFSAQYFRSGDNVYIKDDQEKSVAETLVKGGVVRAISTVNDANPNGASAGSIRADDGREFSQCDVAAHTLMTVEELNGNRHVPFAQLVKEAANVGAPRETVLDSKPVIAIDLLLDRPGITKGAWKLTAYFDPAVNWMIVGTDLSANPTKDRRILRKARVREMREVKPGVFFPLKGDHVLQINDGPVQLLWTSTISDLHVNERIPESMFTLRYADGMRVLDHTQNAMYNVNSRGERITPLQLLQSGDISSERVGLDVIGAPSKAEPPSRTRWLLGAGLGLIVLGLSVKVVRAHRRRTAAGSSVS